MKCYVCGIEITEKIESEEHIILNSLGGKLKSRRLICIDCNSHFGSGIDDSIAHQLQAVATILNVKRDRGKPQNVKAKYGSKEILIEPGGKFKLSRTYHEIDGEILNVVAPSISDAKRLLTGMKRKYPKLDIDEALLKAETESNKHTTATVSMNFGGKATARSFCKTAINFFIYKGGDHKEIQHLLPFIEGKEDEAEVYFFYPRTEIFNKDKAEILHSIILIGDKQRKKLYVIIELFNEFKMLVFLNVNYQGEDIYESYHYNLITNEIVDFETKFVVTPKQLKKSCSKVIDEAKFIERMKILFQQIYNVTVKRKFEEVTDSSMKELIEKYPAKENPYISQNMINEYVHDVINKISEQFIFKGEKL